MAYIITTKEDGIEYFLHSNNALYWNWHYYNNIYPLRYLRRGNALRRIKKIQHKYPHYKLVVREQKERELCQILED